MFGLLRAVFNVLSTVGLGWMISDVHRDFEPETVNPSLPFQPKSFVDTLLGWIGNNKLTFIVISGVVIAYFYFTHKSDKK